MASGKSSGRRRFITREHTSDTSEADTFATKSPGKERGRGKPDAAVHPIGDTPSAFVRVKPSSKTLKSGSLDQSCSNSKNGLVLNSSQSLPLSTQGPKNSENNPDLTSKWNTAHLDPVICTRVKASPGFVPNSPSLGFRPIRKDSVGSESSSLAGSLADSELTISNYPLDRSHSPVKAIKPPSHPAVKDHPTDSTSRLRPSSYYYDSGMLNPRTVLSSTGSASSYDNLDKPDSLLPVPGRESQTSSDLAHASHAPRSPIANRTNCSDKYSKRAHSPPHLGKTSSMHSSPFRSDEDRKVFGQKGQLRGGKTYDTGKESLTGEDRGEIPHFLEGVCRRRMTGGHVQVIPPHLVGVFDPSRFIPASSHTPYEAADDKISERPKMMEAESVSNAGKTLDSMKFKNPETYEMKSSEIGPVNSLPSAQSYTTCHRKPVKGGTTEFRTRPLPPCGSSGVGLSSSENETTYSFNAGKEQDDIVRSKVLEATFSERGSNSTNRNSGNKANAPGNDLSSVTDLFHYAVAKPSVGRTEKEEKHDVQMPNAKTIAFPTTGHSSMSTQDHLKHVSLPTSKNSPEWNSLPLPAGSPKSDPTSPPKGSPIWEPPKLLKEGYTLVQTSSPIASSELQKLKLSPGASPKWQYSPLATSGQVCAATSSPKSSPKYERTSTAQSSPTVERVPSAKTSLKYESTCPSKSSPKAERNSVAKHNMKLETSSSKINVHDNSQLHSQNSLNWEPSKTTRLEAMLASRINDAESNEMNAKVDLDKAENFKAMNRFSLLQSSSASIQAIGSGTNLKSDQENRKQVTGISQLPSLCAPDSVFSAKPFPPSSNGTSADKPELGGEKVLENAIKSRPKLSLKEDATNPEDNRQQMSIITCGKTDINSRIFSAEISDSAQKVTYAVEIITESDSDRLVTMNSEKKSLESRHNVNPTGDVQSAKMTREDSEGVKVLTSQAADAVAVRMEKNSRSGTDSCTALDTCHNFTDIRFAVNSVGSLVTSECKESAVVGNEIREKGHIDTKCQLGAPDDVAGDKIVYDSQNVVESSSYVSSKTKNQCPQTQMFTDTSESIQVVTQPCGAHKGSTSHPAPLVDASSSIPVDLVDIPPVQSPERSEHIAVTLQVPLEHSGPTASNFTQFSADSNLYSQSKDSSLVSAVGAATLPAADEAATLPAADEAVNNIHPESEDRISSKSQINVSIDNQCLNSVNSSPKAEDLCNQKEYNSANQSEDTKTENIALSVGELTLPCPIEKAIFTADKEICFVSHLVESPDHKSSLLTAKSEPCPNSLSALKDVENLEKPMLCIPVSSLAVPPTDVFVTLTVHPLDETPSTFQKPYINSIQDNATPVSNPLEMTSENSCIIPTCDPLSPSPNTIYNLKLVTADSVTVGNEGLASSKFSSPNKNRQDEMFGSKSFSESNDQTGTDSRSSTASFDQNLEGNVTISKSPAVFQTTAMPVTLCSPSTSIPCSKTQNISNNTRAISVFDSSASVVYELPASRKCNLLAADQKLKINDRKWPEKIAGHPDGENVDSSSAHLPDMSPVLAALDDALAVLTSVVMDSKASAAEISRPTAAPVEKSKKELTKQEVERVIFSQHPSVKKGGKSRAFTKDGTSLLSKKKTGDSHRERSSPAVGSHHSDPLDPMDIVRQEIQVVENRRRQLAKEDSFNRPDSPMFHETLPLPKDSIIKRNREKFCESTSSSDNNDSPQMSPRLAPRRLRRCKQQSHVADKSASLPASEVSSHKAFAGSRYSSRSLSRHKSDIFLDTQSGLPSSQHPHKSRWHNSDTADVTQGTWPKTVKVPQGINLAVTNTTAVRDSKRRTDRLPLRSDIQDLQQSVLLYNQQHGGRRGQSWMQMVDASVKETVKGSALPGDKPS